MNEDKKVDNTEEKIRVVAKKLFTERGYANTTIRDVAEEAGVNIALLNYYFRSKDKLFGAIFTENFQEYFQEIAETLFYSDLPLESRIRRFVNDMTDYLKKNPDIPLFIMNECRQNQVPFPNMKKFKMEHFSDSKFAKQLESEAEAGNIRKVDPFQFEFNLSSLVIFPFIGLPILRQMYNLEGEALDNFLEERKQMIVDMMMAYLKKPE